MREIAIFVVIFAILVTILGAVIRLLGGSFGLDFGESWHLALVALVFVVPGVTNIHAFADASGTEDAAQRILALIRGLGMMIAGLACSIPLFTNITDRAVLFWGFGIGFVMNFGTLPLEAFFDHRRRHNK
jgi:hypothetical protein